MISCGLCLCLSGETSASDSTSLCVASLTWKTKMMKGLCPELLEGWDVFMHVKVLARWLDIASAQSSLAMSVIIFWAFTGRGSRCVLRDAEARAETNGCKP